MRAYGLPNLFLSESFVEFDGSLRAMGVAKLFALREQIAAAEAKAGQDDQASYDPQDRSLANTMRALRKCMRYLDKYSYRSPNPDKKPLGEPTIRKLNPLERKTFIHYNESAAAQNASQRCLKGRIASTNLLKNQNGFTA